MLTNELKLTCFQCRQKIATVRRLVGNVEVVYCEDCDDVIGIDEYIAMKYREALEEVPTFHSRTLDRIRARDRSLLLQSDET